MFRLVSSSPLKSEKYIEKALEFLFYTKDLPSLSFKHDVEIGMSLDQLCVDVLRKWRSRLI